MWYPGPAKRRAQWKGLLQNAGVDFLTSGHVLPLPWPSEQDWDAARSWVAGENELSGRAAGAAVSQHEQELMLRRYARRHHWCRLVMKRAAARGTTHLAIWGGIGRRRVMVDAARAAGLRFMFAELAPFKGKMTLDPDGVNAVSSLPQDIDYYLDWARDHPGELPLDKLTANLVARQGVRRGNAGEAQADRPFIFVPLQVRNDAQVMRYGGWLRGVPAFIDAIAAASAALPPDWRVVFREHPSCKVGNAEQLRSLVGDRIAVDNVTDTFELVRRSQGVATLNSSVGLQSFLLDRPVLVLGQANYALPGLVSRATGQTQLVAAFTGVGGWSFDRATRHAFLRFLLEEYYVDWPIVDSERSRRQVLQRLKGRITDWVPASPR